MDRPGEKYLKQHQRLARGDPDPFDNSGFGVEKMASMCAGGGEGMNRKHLRDHERGASVPVGGNQANADHGPHKKGVL